MKATYRFPQKLDEEGLTPTASTAAQPVTYFHTSFSCPQNGCFPARKDFTEFPLPGTAFQAVAHRHTDMEFAGRPVILFPAAQEIQLQLSLTRRQLGNSQISLSEKLQNINEDQN